MKSKFVIFLVAFIILNFVVIFTQALSGCCKEVTTTTNVKARDINLNVLVLVDKETAAKLSAVP
jgi:hypothetical protein